MRSIPDLRLPYRSPSWKWGVCGLLLLATTVNYMDRLTLNQLSAPILQDFGLGDPEYGQLESAFGVAFALGAIVLGWLADQISVRWLYPAAVLVWSAAGFATGLVGTFAALLACRFVLGLAEAGNWACALRTTQHILPPAERTMGNGILQSGAAVGAVLTPLVVLVVYRTTHSWRPAFLIVGVLGAVWAAGWLVLVRRRDLPAPRRPAGQSLAPILGWLVALYATDLAAHLLGGPPWLGVATKSGVTALGIAGVVLWLAVATRGDRELPRSLFFRRFAALAVVVVTINATWHFFRVWLPRFLQEQHGYSLEELNYFSIGYYVSTDLGSLGAGAATLALARGGLAVHASRVIVFAACALVTTLSLVAAVLPAGLALLGVLLAVGFAALGLFPAYYSFSQDLTVEHQGKLTGALGCTCWMSLALLHEVVGGAVGGSKSYSAGVACAGLLPLLGLLALLLLWGRSPRGPLVTQKETSPPAPPEAIRLPAPGEILPAAHRPRWDGG
jgi:ACS family hexuronate transporter-like MFS transporter